MTAPLRAEVVSMRDQTCELARELAHQLILSPTRLTQEDIQAIVLLVEVAEQLTNLCSTSSHETYAIRDLPEQVRTDLESAQHARDNMLLLSQQDGWLVRRG